MACDFASSIARESSIDAMMGFVWGCKVGILSTIMSELFSKWNGAGEERWLGAQVRNLPPVPCINFYVPKAMEDAGGHIYYPTEFSLMHYASA